MNFFEIVLLMSLTSIANTQSSCATRGPSRIQINDDALHDAGTWGTYEECPLAQRVYRYRMKIERPTGDDTALNTIELTCTGGNTIKSAEGSWGDLGSYFTCPNGAHITGFQLKGLKCSYCDDMGATNLNMKCNDSTILTGVSSISSGTWGAWIECPKFYYICGLKTKVVAPCGGCDDVALTKVTFTCCAP